MSANYISNPPAPPSGAPGAPRPRRTLSSLQPGDRVDGEIFLVASKDLRSSNNGSLYIHAVLTDRTGQMQARMWDATRELFESMTVSKPMALRGRVESYKGKPQFIIDGVQTVDPSKIDYSEFLPRTARDVEQMWARLKEILRDIKSPDLLALLGKFVNDPAFVSAFKKAPAARTNHHAYIGGLLEHTLNLLELAQVVLPKYPRVSADLVLAGVFLHDCGKTTELGFENSFDYTAEGQLVGHIAQAIIWIHERAAAVVAERGKPFPAELLTCLKHIILAHHGQYEFGSPRLPATAEAFMVHYLDNLDAKLAMVFAAIDADIDPANDWTQWVNALSTRVYKRDALAAPPTGCGLEKKE